MNSRPSLSVPICKEDENVAAILLCASSPELLRAVRTKQDKIILEMKSLISFGMLVKDKIYNAAFSSTFDTSMDHERGN